MWMPWSINSLAVVKWWYSNSSILFSFISWNNFMKICFSSPVMWLPSGTIHIRKARYLIISLNLPVFKTMNWFPFISQRPIDFFPYHYELRFKCVLRCFNPLSLLSYQSSNCLIFGQWMPLPFGSWVLWQDSSRFSLLIFYLYWQDFLGLFCIFLSQS